MTFEPKLLTKGWVKRCLINAVQIVSRSKRDALLIYVLLPLCSVFIPFLTGKVVFLAVSFIFGMIFCLKQDKHQTSSWIDMIKHFSGYAQILISVLLVALGVGWMFGDIPQPENIIENALLLPFITMLMYFSFLVAVIPYLLLLLLCIGGVLAYKYLKTREISDQDMEKYAHMATELSVGDMPTFTFFITGDTGLAWAQASELNEQAARMVRRSGWFTFLLPISVFFLLPLYIIGFPFLYAVYLELFWDGKLSPKVVKQPSADNEAAQTVYTSIIFV